MSVPICAPCRLEIHGRCKLVTMDPNFGDRTRCHCPCMGLERKVWTLTVDDDNGITTTVHASEEEAIAELRSRYFEPLGDDDDAPEDDAELIDYATEQAGLVLYIDEHDMPGTRPQEAR